MSTVSTGHIVSVDLYSDGATLVKSCSQSATFVRVHFSYLKIFSELWYTVGIAPSTGLTPVTLFDEVRRKLELKLIQRFIFLLFKRLITASYKGVVSSGAIYISRISMFIYVEPEERTLSYFKR